jgi:hypothetical protein
MKFRFRENEPDDVLKAFQLMNWNEYLQYPDHLQNKDLLKKLSVALKKASLRFHPDKGGNEEDFKLSQGLRDTLEDDDKRRILIHTIKSMRSDTRREREERERREREERERREREERERREREERERREREERERREREERERREREERERREREERERREREREESIPIYNNINLLRNVYRPPSTRITQLRGRQLPGQETPRPAMPQRENIFGGINPTMCDDLRRHIRHLYESNDIDKIRTEGTMPRILTTIRLSEIDTYMSHTNEVGCTSEIFHRLQSTMHSMTSLINRCIEEAQEVCSQFLTQIASDYNGYGVSEYVSKYNYRIQQIHVLGRLLDLYMEIYRTSREELTIRVMNEMEYYLNTYGKMVGRDIRSRFMYIKGLTNPGALEERYQETVKLNKDIKVYLATWINDQEYTVSRSHKTLFKKAHEMIVNKEKMDVEL